ncbi:hydroxyisourate hydrolase [Actinokineospora sp. NBRC 105648]|uniref:hydroxyisourate hydrolase n=1 Tax=Actinokineospora sp. NBRC 105648 TaxID=3032206 RepID=UPI0024A28A6D|nr:hydroxyisourate hydrolase [Actinokineospora sp. NBRC 105648]GLZ39032.1 5-hydroxyisourate hydrolase [Actinokineospora sp. NBRC 105648]
MSATLSTHVLDTSRGTPAAGVAVRHEVRRGGRWRLVDEARTDADGRFTGWSAEPGEHRLVFDTGAYLGPDAFYPEVAVAFRVSAGHYHVPLLISPFGYSTYRGS